MKRFYFLFLLLLVTSNILAQNTKLPDKGYFGSANFTFSVYNGNEFQSYGVDVINGYKVCNFFKVGAGIGVRSMNWDTFVVPLYIHLRTDILDRKVSPYISVNIGGAYMTDVYLFSEILSGVSICVNKQQKINIGIGGTIHLNSSCNGAMGFITSIGYSW